MSDTRVAWPLLIVIAAAGCSGAPKECSSDPHGFVCRNYHHQKAMDARAKRSAAAANNFGTPGQTAPSKHKAKSKYGSGEI